MRKDRATAVLSKLAAPSLGVFRGTVALEHGVTRDQLTRLCTQGVVERVHPDVYRLTAVRDSAEQQLRAALLWAGDGSAATGRSAAVLYGLEGVDAAAPEIAVPHGARTHGTRTDRAGVVVRHGDRRTFLTRRVRGVPATGPEYTLLWLAHELGAEALEIAFEDARRRRLTSLPALASYLERFGRRGRPGIAALRALADELDPRHPARSSLEVRARRLLVAHGLTGFVREFPLEGNGRRFRYDFAFVAERVILETNGRRWHDDPADYEHDQEKWSVPARHGFRIVFATWDKVTRAPGALIEELRLTMRPPARISA